MCMWIMYVYIHICTYVRICTHIWAFHVHTFTHVRTSNNFFLCYTQLIQSLEVCTSCWLCFTTPQLMEEAVYQNVHVHVVLWTTYIVTLIVSYPVPHRQGEGHMVTKEMKQCTLNQVHLQKQRFIYVASKLKVHFYKIRSCKNWNALNNVWVWCVCVYI